MAVNASHETLGFQAEVKQLLKLMIHSLYSHKEIFLRELISNASDACDKLRFEAISRTDLVPATSDLKIRIECDEANATLSIADNGIGMSREEATAHLGTIARSGTAEFLTRLTGDQQKDAQLIGQFGVGFYSAFIVAERVEVYSRRADLPASAGVRWESRGDGEFSVETVELEATGTTVVLHLKPDEREFAQAFRIRSLVRKYSDHIAFPVRMPASDDATGEETVNHAQALWTRPRADVSEQEYREFYRHITHDLTEPLAWTHNRIEGAREFTALLYIPARAPFDLWNREAARGVKLYVRRVFIMDDAEQFLPLYLRFVRGVVDSSDLPLNVSRELLQEDATVESMRSALARRTLELLTKLANDDPDKYARFWQEFGVVLKEGLAEDPGNRERLAPLLRFASTASSDDTENVSLTQYVARMKPGQDSIYYLTAESRSVARSSPQLEALKARDLEVLLLTDRADEWLIDHLREFDGRKLRNVARGTLDLAAIPMPDADRQAPATEIADGTIQRIEAALGDRVAEIRRTDRLVDSAACLVLGEHDLSAQMQRLLEAAGQSVPASRPTLEINPHHPLLDKLARTSDDTTFADLALLLYEQAALADGRPLEDPAAFVQRLNRLLLGA
ncbi:MAG TPA: molecular chaperone HtpG [Steroidobacteraceae bacterium]|nr:molecular chaperone HtpG [Steroidobacteraceae bacterium]